MAALGRALTRPARRRMALPPRRLKPFLLRAIAVVLSTTLMLGLAEIGLRVAGYKPLKDVSAPDESDRGQGRGVILRESDDPDVIYELVPNAEGDAWGCHVKVSSGGFHDVERPLQKPPGVYRIAALGDSITFGNGLRLEDTYPRRLAALFHDGGWNVDVMNLGVGGYDPLQEVALLEKRGLQYAPDHVMVGYCVNDTGVHSLNLKYIRQLQEYGSWWYRVRLIQLVAMLRDKYSMARSDIAANEEGTFERENKGRIADISGDREQVARIARLREVVGQSRAAGHPFLPWYTSEARIGKLRAAFERLGRARDRVGFKVTVLIIPYVTEEREDEYRLVYDIVRHEATRLGFHVVEARDQFAEAGFGRLRLHSYDPLHPSALGHDIMARRLYEDIVAGLPATARSSH